MYGLLLFGLSTAVLIAVMSHLITNCLWHQLNPPGEEKPEASDLEIRSERVLP